MIELIELSGDRPGRSSGMSRGALATSASGHMLLAKQGRMTLPVKAAALGRNRSQPEAEGGAEVLTPGRRRGPPGGRADGAGGRGRRPGAARRRRRRPRCWRRRARWWWPWPGDPWPPPIGTLPPPCRRCLRASSPAPPSRVRFPSSTDLRANACARGNAIWHYHVRHVWRLSKRNLRPGHGVFASPAVVAQQSRAPVRSSLTEKSMLLRLVWPLSRWQARRAPVPAVISAKPLPQELSAAPGKGNSSGQERPRDKMAPAPVMAICWDVVAHV